MITQFSLRLLRFSVGTAYYCKMSPYRWNWKQDRPEVANSRAHRLLYTITRLLFAINQFVLTGRVADGLVDPKTPTVYRLMTPVYWMSYSVTTLVMFMLTANEALFLQWANESLMHFNRAQRQYLHNKKKAIAIAMDERKRSGSWSWSERLGLGITLSPYLAPVPVMATYFSK